MELIFHKKFSGGQLNFQVRRAQGLLPKKNEPVARLPHMNGVTPSHPGLLPDLSLSKLQLLPSVVTGEDAKEDPVTDFLTNQLGPVDGLEVSSISSPSISDLPRLEDPSSLLLRTIKDVANSIPGLAVESWKNRVMSSMWKKFNPPSNENSSSIDLMAEVKRQIDSFFNEQKSQPKKTDKPEVIRKYEESQKKDAELSLPDSAGASSENGGHPEEPVKPSPDTQARFPLTIPPQPKITADAADEENNNSTETNSPPVATGAPSDSGTNPDVGSDSKTTDVHIDIGSKSDLSNPVSDAGTGAGPAGSVADPLGNPKVMEAAPNQPPANATGSEPGDGKTVPPIIPQPDMNNADPTVLTPSLLDGYGSGTGAVIDSQKARTEVRVPEYKEFKDERLVETEGDGGWKIPVVVAGVLGGFWIFEPLLRKWIFEDSNSTAVPNQQTVQKSAPVLYGVPPTTSAKGYARVNDPSGAACF